MVTRWLTALIAAKHLVRRVVAVLLRVEDAPLAVLVPRVRRMMPEDSLLRRVAVRDVETGDLVVAVVLAVAAVGRVERRGRVASLRQPTERNVPRLRIVEVTSIMYAESRAFRCLCSVSPASSTKE